MAKRKRPGGRSDVTQACQRPPEDAGDSSARVVVTCRKYPVATGACVAVLLSVLTAVALNYHPKLIEGFRSLLPYLERALNVEEQVKRVDIEKHQNVSLFSRYSLDFRDTSRIRNQNMKKYSFEYKQNGVDKRSNLSLQEYRDVYDGKWPVVVTDVVPDWPAAKWSRDFFKEHYGAERTTMKAVHGGLDDAVSLALPIDLFYENTHKAHARSWTYVQDEVFISQHPELYGSIGQTVYLEEDFFKLFPPEVRPWDAMLLWGTAYSRSALHIDPYNWTGTNAVISGHKRWKLYPPGQDQYLYVKPGQLSGFPLNCYKYNSKIDAFDPDLERFPKFKQAKALEFDQLPGELLLIPSGWFHQAYNVEETIAVSSQVMNRNNFRVVLEEVLKVPDNVRRTDVSPGVDQVAPEEQVKAVMAHLPEDILKRGQAVTQDVLHQIQHGYQENPQV